MYKYFCFDCSNELAMYYYSDKAVRFCPFCKGHYRATVLETNKIKKDLVDYKSRKVGSLLLISSFLCVFLMVAAITAGYFNLIEVKFSVVSMFAGSIIWMLSLIAGLLIIDTRAKQLFPLKEE